MLVQHNYTPDIISKFANAANLVSKHSEKNGIMFATSRQVTPKTRKGKALKRPVLIDIEVHNFKFVK